MSNESDDLFDVQGNISIPKEEEKILEFWNKIDAFQTSLKKSEGKKEVSIKHLTNIQIILVLIL